LHKKYGNIVRVAPNELYFTLVHPRQFVAYWILNSHIQEHRRPGSLPGDIQCVKHHLPVCLVFRLADHHIIEAGNKFHKAAAYNVVQGTRSFDLVGQRNEKIHSEQRKLVARAYSMDSMVLLEPKVDIVISQMIGQLDKLDGETIDLGFWLQLYAFGM
jgi:hypothetical protein